MPRSRVRVPTSRLARQLSGLGYPNFAHLRAEKANPAVLILQALIQRDLEVRLIEALPWVLGTYADLSWKWLLDQARLKAPLAQYWNLLTGLTVDQLSYAT
jgi:hypothetical protein